MCGTTDADLSLQHVCVAGGVLRLKQNLESRLGRPQQEALLTSYGVAALLANKNDIAKEAIRCVNLLPHASIDDGTQRSTCGCSMCCSQVYYSLKHHSLGADLQLQVH